MKPLSEFTNYDQVAEKYIAHAENERSWNNLYERPYMLSVFNDFKNKSVLDAGSGTGFYSLYASSQGADVISVDISQRMLDHISEKDSLDKIRLVRANVAAGFPFLEDESQDFIICSLVLHYIENWENLLADMKRVLRKNGKVYISTHHPFNDMIHLNKENYFEKGLVSDRWGTMENTFDVHYYTRSMADLLKPFLNSGFSILNIDEPQPDPVIKKIDPDAYTFFCTKPAFIFLILEKR